MRKQEIIDMIRRMGGHAVEFDSPILVKLSPHDIGVRVFSLEIKNTELWIHLEGSSVMWELSSLPVRQSIGQRMKLAESEKENSEQK